MKNSKFRGIGDVFKFTYIQSMKSKATSVTLIIFCLLGLLTFPIVSLISGDSTTSSTNAITFSRSLVEGRRYFIEITFTSDAITTDVLAAEEWDMVRNVIHEFE